MPSKILAILFFILQIQAATGQYKTELFVALDGSGDFTSIQEAIDNAKAFPYERITIHIKNGVYREKVKVHAWNPMITLLGESREKTVITWDDYFDKIARGRNSTFHTWTLLVQGNDFRAENLTIENTAGPVGQALALSVEADRCRFINCAFKGHQDTLYTAGEGARQYYKNCYIEGTTDFIFGEATAVFDHCEVHSLTNSFVTAASTPKGAEYGYVFLHCRLTAAEGVDKVYLGRPWRSFARTVYLHCELGPHILPKGWDNWSSADNEKTAYYAEYQSAGPGAAPDQRAGWSHQLTKREARRYTLARIFRGWAP
ncbi:MAG TPA: pectinesterase family protein [Flavilitoribacter sp.]|nr:pectinesterase family protein [Flavilitoribacter sp.]HMQ90338.1 pectinesterase family protein [Flavilitoribacter sp.]